jgi:hypothetical protein
MNPVPIPAGATAANCQDPIVIFDRATIDFRFFLVHWRYSILHEGVVSIAIKPPLARLRGSDNGMP